MKMVSKYVKVFTDDFYGIVMSYEEYINLIPHMSTGDYSTHLVLPFVGNIDNLPQGAPWFSDEEYLDTFNG